ncbi:MAG: type I glyceraldehyde-3-phosphate dehydrogenase [Candidatus Marinimicrobia bacterium]|nr:type I glyceraldehyde-3-phosphate dehydrogenase [Candidatus Neomarinimicrobiota bacterium]MCF7828480.1 type I glyceraldehyde-3-phosphate dehydrogenase [Candidatus Neomarinimicrobiota bacterium]MCF7881970.1 type I glyceraldehyde-3-phosphate dehydrogenase [Candidatus Neomarinimicrobiota bacterium]
MPNVAINGMGRIGRALLKNLLDKPEFDVVAVNDIADIENIAYLLKFDSVYGRLGKSVETGDKKLIIDGESFDYLSERDPGDLPWADKNVDLVFECTGLFTTKKASSAHVDAGAKHVIMSAPAKDEDTAMVVHGVNSEAGDGQNVISCASCTTNCISPVVEVLDRHFGVEKATMTTIHAYTSSQAIVDGPHKKFRRGRAGAVNFVPTSTGAAIATTKALPQLKGKFDGAAIRGPIPVGSIADIVFQLSKDVTVEEINDVFAKEAESDRYKGVLGASDEHLVSSDILKDSRASIVDLTMTQVVGGDLVKVMSWYDNEWGYVNQMIREASRILSV